MFPLGVHHPGLYLYFLTSWLYSPRLSRQEVIDQFNFLRTLISFPRFRSKDCRDDYALLGCYADQDRNRIMTKSVSHEPMTAKVRQLSGKNIYVLEAMILLQYYVVSCETKGWGRLSSSRARGAAVCPQCRIIVYLLIETFLQDGGP